MFKWKVGFAESDNNAKKIMKRCLPLNIMNLTDTDLNKQFTIYPLCVGTHKEHSTRELVFKLYEAGDYKILCLIGCNSVQAVAELLSELPPVYIFHAELSLTTEKFIDLSYLDMLNAVYAIKINGYTELFLHNLNKVIEANLQFYWIE